MNRSERMKIVESVAEHEEQQECRAMGESQRKLEDELGRLEELKTYRQTYVPKQKLKNGLRGLEWQDYHRFLNRLEQAVAAQEQVVRDGKSQRTAHRERWAIKRQRLESLSRVVDRYKVAEHVERERQLRKIQDSQRIPTSPFDQED